VGVLQAGDAVTAAEFTVHFVTPARWPALHDLCEPHVTNSPGSSGGAARDVWLRRLNGTRGYREAMLNARRAVLTMALLASISISPTAASGAMLLDRLLPDWHGRVLPGGEAVEDVLRDALERQRGTAP
jgi:hypothetical protein